MTGIPKYTRSKNPISIDIDLVDFTPYNPLPRREDVDTLKASILASGQLEPAHVVFDPATHRYILADGNRRTQALKEIGVEKLLAYVYQASDVSASLDFLFRELNKDRMTLKNGQALQAALQGGPTFNTTVRSAQRFFETHFSVAERAGLVKQCVTPTLLANAKRIATYCVPGVGKDTPTYFARVRKTLYWLLRYRTQQDCVAYMRRGYSAEALKNAIDKNKDAPPGFKGSSGLSLDLR